MSNRDPAFPVGLGGTQAEAQGGTCLSACALQSGPLGASTRCHHGTVWTYGLFDFDPGRDGDEDAWAAKLAAESWQTWAAGRGPWIKLDGRLLRRWSLRREAAVVARTP